ERHRALGDRLQRWLSARSRAQVRRRFVRKKPRISAINSRSHKEEPMTLSSFSPLAMLHQTRGAAGALAGAILALAVSIAPHAAYAQAYPSKPIMAVIPFAPGNANDVVARIVLDQLQKQLGQPIVIENRAGAGGTTGVAFVAKAAPDGYTVLVHSSTFSAAYSLYKPLPYD